MLGLEVNCRFWVLLVLVLGMAATSATANPLTSDNPITPKSLLPGFRQSAWFHEQIREEWIEPGVRVLLNASENFDPARPTELILFATPNGNTIEQTLGSAMAAGTDWHFDIQHIAAQTRRLRQITPEKNIVLPACRRTGEAGPRGVKSTPITPSGYGRLWTA